ncbi:MAG TPA: translocation/assembly module TamB domain-containing protein [Verrucomicrobiae bacterium]
MGGAAKGRRWGRRLLIVIALGLVAMVALAFTYAYWLPYAARPVAKRFGVTFGTYERLKDGRFVLTEVVRTNRSFDLRISRVEGFLPHVWRSKLQGTNSTNATVPFVQVNGWRVVIHEREKKDKDSKPKRDRTVYGEWERVERYIAKARELVPKATLLNGTIEHRKKEYTVAVATWDKGMFEANGVWPETAVPFDIKGKLTGEPPYQLSYAMTPLDLRARLRVVETNGLLNAQLATFYKENRADVTANFAPGGKLPETATLKAPGFKLPGEMLKLDKYAEVSGSLNGEWKTNQYTVELKAHAEPLQSATNMPPGDLEIAARGDTNSVRVERATSTIPGLELTVTAPLELSYKGKMLSQESRVRVNLDFEKLPWVKMKGRVQGTILLERGEDFPKATFEARGTNVSALKFEAEVVQVRGVVDWPRVDGVAAEVQFDKTSKFTLSGGGDVRARVLTNVVVNAEGGFLTNVLPQKYRFSDLRLAARANGSVTNLQHGGEIELRDFTVPQLHPLTVQGAWKAQQITFDNLAVRARAGPATFYVSGSGYAGGGRTNFVVRELNFFKGEEEYLKLQAPARVTVSPNLQVEIEPLMLAGAERRLHLSAGLRPPEVIVFEVRATNVSPALFQPFVTRSLSGLDLEQLNVVAGWSNGPVVGSVAGRFSVQEENFERLTAAVDIEAATNGLTIRQLSIFNPEAEICRANGFVPATLYPRELEKLRVNRDGEISFEATTVSNAAFWETMTRLTKVHLSNATVRLAVSGSVKRPAGELRVKAAGLEYRRGEGKLPSVGAFEGVVSLSEQVMRVPEFSFRVEDQPITLSGNLPLGENFWTQRREEIRQYAIDNGEFRVLAPEVNLAAFTEYLPKYLRAQGKISADVSMHRGKNFEGLVRLGEVETRPLPKIGVVQEIQAELALRGKTVHFENVSGVLGGERLSLGGTVDLSAESVATGYPDLNLTIAGYNVPLARNPDVILRSDLQLRVTNSVNRIPVVSGTATLRDSFLLRDITTLVPGRIARPDRRPPYFSLEQDPIDEWLLDVRVRGENFMRVRSPFFQGLASANFHVTGTMVEPLALGEATISSGTIVFPFATLKVRQALVSLTSENPYMPQIFVAAGGRAYGFDVRMEAEGPADEPILEFSSVPSLTSEQVVLMLTTGQIPRADFGFSREDRAGKLALFLGKSLWSKLNPSRAAQEEKLTVRSGEDVTEQGKQTYEVEYKINDRWSLVGEYDRFGDLNANVKWRVFSR